MVEPEKQIIQMLSGVLEAASLKDWPGMYQLIVATIYG